jgi:hypothetical protein
LTKIISGVGSFDSFVLLAIPKSSWRRADFQMPQTVGHSASARQNFHVIHRLGAIKPSRHRREIILQTAGAIEQHHTVSRADLLVGDRLLIGREGRCSFGTHQEPFLAGYFLSGVKNRLIRDSEGEAAALTQREIDRAVSAGVRFLKATCPEISVSAILPL